MKFDNNDNTRKRKIYFKVKKANIKQFPEKRFRSNSFIVNRFHLFF